MSLLQRILADSVRHAPVLPAEQAELFRFCRRCEVKWFGGVTCWFCGKASR